MKRILLGIFFILALLLVPALASAQGVGITSVNFRQYLPGATVPVTGPFNILVAGVTCNLVASTAQPVHSLRWTNPVNAGAVCQWVDPGTGPLFAAVYRALTGTLTNLAGTIESTESTPPRLLRGPRLRQEV